jgi:hypothetical protein
MPSHTLFELLALLSAIAIDALAKDRTSTSSARVSICTQILNVRGDDAILAIPKSNGNSSKDVLEKLFRPAECWID